MSKPTGHHRKISARQNRFAEVYAETGDARRSAVAAWYADTALAAQVRNLLGHPVVRRRIAELSGIAEDQIDSLRRPDTPTRFAHALLAEGGRLGDAAIAAGLSPATATAAGSRLLRDERTRAALADLFDQADADPSSEPARQLAAMAAEAIHGERAMDRLVRLARAAGRDAGRRRVTGRRRIAAGVDDGR